MSIIQHGVIGGIIGYVMSLLFGGHYFLFITLCTFLGVLPDIIGFSEKVYKKDKNVWNWYKKAHLIDVNTQWKWLIVPILPYSIHLLIDNITHEAKGRWNSFAYKVEIVGWLINIAIIYLITMGI